MDDDSDTWAQQELCERQRFEEEQALLRADAGFDLWLESLELKHEKDDDNGPEQSRL